MLLSPIRTLGHLHNVLGKVVSEPLPNSIGDWDFVVQGLVIPFTWLTKGL